MRVPVLHQYQYYRKLFRPWSAIRFPLTKWFGLVSAQPVHLTGIDPSLVYLRPGSSDIATLREVFLKQEYGQAITQLPDAPVIVDLGANIGLTSRYFLHHRPAARIIAVEALPETFAIAELNLGLPQIEKQCRTINAAVWSEDGDISVELPSPGAYSRAKVGPGGSVTVRALRLDTLLEQAGVEYVDLLKIDIEGAEVHLFRNVDDWIGRIHTLQIEFHGTSREECFFDDAMCRHGFHVLRSTPHTVTVSRSSSRAEY